MAQRNVRRIKRSHLKGQGKSMPMGRSKGGKSAEGGPKVTRLAVKPLIKGQA